MTEVTPKRNIPFSGEYLPLTEIIYSVNGLGRCTVVLYNDHYKKYAVMGGEGSWTPRTKDFKFPEDQKRHYKDIFDAKAFAVAFVRGMDHAEIVTVK